MVNRPVETDKCVFFVGEICVLGLWIVIRKFSTEEI